MLSESTPIPLQLPLFASVRADAERTRTRRQEWVKKRYDAAKARPVDPLASKTCKRCSVAQPITAFALSAFTRDGRQGTCKECYAARSRMRHTDFPDRRRAAARQRYYQNRAQCQARHRQWLAEHKADVQAYKRLYRSTHSQEIVAAWSRYYYENKAALAPKREAYRRAHLAQFSTYAKVRQAREKTNGGTLRASDIGAIYAMQRGLCAYCDGALPARFHIEHKTPVVQGGRSDPDNICLACPPCNLQKGTRTEEEFRALRNRTQAQCESTSATRSSSTMQ